MTLRQRFARRERMLATWLTVPSQQVIEAIALSGLDFGVIDREHGPHSVQDVQILAASSSARGMPVLARPNALSQGESQRLLDTGVEGLQFAGISTLDQAIDAVNMSFFPPIGIRGFSPFTRSGSYGDLIPSNIVEQANRDTVVILNIESDMDSSEIASIAELEGVSGVFIGLFDLSVSLGIPGDFSHPAVLGAVRKIASTVSECGTSVGTIVQNREEMDLFETYGMNFFFLSADTNVLRSAYKQRVLDFGV